MEAPNSKVQTPTKSQIPASNQGGKRERIRRRQENELNSDSRRRRLGNRFGMRRGGMWVCFCAEVRRSKGKSRSTCGQFNGDCTKLQCGSRTFPPEWNSRVSTRIDLASS